MRFRTLLIAFAFSFLLVRPAPADPFDFHLDEFIAEVDRLIDELDENDPAQQLRARFLKKLDKVLDKKSKSLATDAGRAGGLARLLERAGDILVELTDDLSAALASIRGNVDALVANIQSRADDLPDGTRQKIQANKKLVKIRDLLANADPDHLAALGKAYKRALLKRRVVAKIVKKGERKYAQ